MSVTLSGNGLLLLPSPEKENSEAFDVRVDSKRSMNGTRYTYVKSNTDKRFTLVFENIERNVMIDLENFYINNVGNQFTYIDHLGNVRTVIFADGSLGFNTDGRFASSTARNEAGSVTLNLIGL